jgi:hypothetical protein
MEEVGTMDSYAMGSGELGKMIQGIVDKLIKCDKK